MQTAGVGFDIDFVRGFIFQKNSTLSNNECMYVHIHTPAAANLWQIKWLLTSMEMISILNSQLFGYTKSMAEHFTWSFCVYSYIHTCLSLRVLQYIQYWAITKSMKAFNSLK